jgi:hypothetical protein
MVALFNGREGMLPASIGGKWDADFIVISSCPLSWEVLSLDLLGDFNRQVLASRNRVSNLP